jgi:hypothetical protein
MGVEEVLDEKGDGLDVHTSLLQSGEVHVAGREALADVETLEQDPIGQIVVAIPDQGVSMERVGPIIPFIGRGTGREQEWGETAEGDAASR